MIKRFRNKPVMVEAVYYDGSAESFKECQEFAKDCTLIDKSDSRYFMAVDKDQHVTCYCAVGQWLVRNDQGLLFAIGKDFLEANWEEAIDQQNAPLRLFLCRVGQWDAGKKVEVTEDYLKVIEEEFRRKGMIVIRNDCHLSIVVEVSNFMDCAAFFDGLRYGIAVRFLSERAQ